MFLNFTGFFVTLPVFSCKLRDSSVVGGLASILSPFPDIRKMSVLDFLLLFFSVFTV